MQTAALFAAVLGFSQAASSEQLQYYCSGNWDNGSTVFDERHFVFYLDTEAGEYSVEGLNEGSFSRKDAFYRGVEADDSGKTIKQFSLNATTLEYQFSYFAEELGATVGSQGGCALNAAP